MDITERVTVLERQLTETLEGLIGALFRIEALEKEVKIIDGYTDELSDIISRLKREVF